MLSGRQGDAEKAGDGGPRGQALDQNPALPRGRTLRRYNLPSLPPNL